MGLLTGIVVTILGVIGFAVTGPVAGSIAATIQSVCYGGAVGAGSWFAMAQSVAMAAPTPWFAWPNHFAIYSYHSSSCICLWIVRLNKGDNYMLAIPLKRIPKKTLSMVVNKENDRRVAVEWDVQTDPHTWSTQTAKHPKWHPDYYRPQLTLRGVPMPSVALHHQYSHFN